jgi:hypothetical protein
MRGRAARNAMLIHTDAKTGRRREWIAHAADAVRFASVRAVTARAAAVVGEAAGARPFGLALHCLKLPIFLIGGVTHPGPGSPTAGQRPAAFLARLVVRLICSPQEPTSLSR